MSAGPVTDGALALTRAARSRRPAARALVVTLVRAHCYGALPHVDVGVEPEESEASECFGEVDESCEEGGQIPRESAEELVELCVQLGKVRGGPCCELRQ